MEYVLAYFQPIIDQASVVLPLTIVVVGLCVMAEHYENNWK